MDYVRSIKGAKTKHKQVEEKVFYSHFQPSFQRTDVRVSGMFYYGCLICTVLRHASQMAFSHKLLKQRQRKRILKSAYK